MTQQTRIEVNCSTGEIIEHILTDAELQQQELDAITYATQQAEREAAEAAKAVAKESANTKLAAWGLTAEEIAAL
jgi:hypothetical protein